MKKAKEYVKEIKKSKDEDSINKKLKEVFTEMVTEISELMESRGVKSNKATKAIILQQQQKWRSIARQLAKEGIEINENGFIEFLKVVLPDTELILRA